MSLLTLEQVFEPPKRRSHITVEQYRHWRETHRQHIRDYNKHYKRLHPEWQSNARSKQHRKERLQLIDFLGGECINCGIIDDEILVFDHKLNDGRLEKRRMYSAWIVKYYLRHLKDAKRRLQLLCYNCNWKKESIVRELRRLEDLRIPPF